MNDLSDRRTVYEQIARIGKALCAPARLEILDLLAQAPHDVQSLARKSGLSVANTSQHLRLLHAARLVDAAKNGQHVVYRLAEKSVAHFLRALRILAEERLAEIHEIAAAYYHAQEDLQPIDRKGLVDQVSKGLVTVIDVRPPEEYAAGHIRGAISLPLPELRRKLRLLPRDQSIVAYCRGPYCVLAVQAVEFLRSKGFSAMRLSDSVHDWQADGLPVD
ncbi:MAG: metalloregulator ArsR/SmtB family transcription factor [Smithellaceae bacterium]|nr:metalloregulator ArsR/SmtB family transcription factor [Smithellaceae bacterium]